MVKRSRDMVNALQKLDAPIRYSEYHGIGHGSWKPAYAEPDFLKWLFSHRRRE
jgi:enterochelin esterase-like enzyme